MYHYSLTQWLLFFYIYCFLGWLWESCYVSVKKKEWVNRGFMHGPFLPIYGFGAILILLSTIPVKENVVLVFLMGLTASTLLELCTGACMEKLFHVKYWDYTKEWLNYHGYICLKASIGWGLFSILLIRIIHVPVESLVFLLPELVTDLAAFIVTVAVVSDFTESFNEAMDLKQTLVKLSESNETIRRVQKRLEVVSAVMENDYQEYKKRKEKKALSRKETFLDNLNAQRQKKAAQLQELMDKLEAYISAGQEKTEDLFKFKKLLEKEMRNMSARTDKAYLRAARLLKRNPGAVSRKYEKELHGIQELIQRHKKKES